MLTTPGSRSSVRRLALSGFVVALVITLVVGMFVGRWAVKNQVAPRLRAELAKWLPAEMDAVPPPAREGSQEWQPLETHLARLETTTVSLPDADGWGGGLASLPDGRVLYATRTGSFGVLNPDGSTAPLPFQVDMNLDALARHPVVKYKTWNPMWVRLTDFKLRPLGQGRDEIVVGHHYFDAKNSCMQLRLSRGVIQSHGLNFELVEPFRVVLTTNPCITFNEPTAQYAFEGHFSGGRIALLPGRKLLFSTGDHGWAGLRGRPAVSQDDGSTLGKILEVDVDTAAVSTFAKGVRNPQGLVIDSQGRIWETEHGPRGGDELNLITKGGNYGWPYVTYGTDYGPKPWPMSAEQGRHAGFGIAPRFSWVPSIGISNVIEVRHGGQFPLWKGDLLVLSLRAQTLHRVRLEGDHVAYIEPIPLEARLRDVVELGDGRLAVLTDQGSVMLVRNAERQGVAPYLDASRQQPVTDSVARAIPSGLATGSRVIADAPREATTLAVPSEQVVAAVQPPGALVFQARCASCHAITPGSVGVGPSLSGVVGRRVGSGEYAYSKALAHQPASWTPEGIVEFVQNPSAKYQGTAMPPVRLNDAERRQLRDYLQATAGR